MQEALDKGTAPAVTLDKQEGMAIVGEVLERRNSFDLIFSVKS